MDLLRKLSPRHAPDARSLSAYADGSLDARAASALDTHLATCTLCRERLEELRRVRALLGALPEAEPPRSFRLTRAMAAAPAPRPADARPAPWTGALGLLRPALPALSGVSLAVFAMLLAIDASGSGGGASDSDGAASVPAAAGIRDLAAESQATDEAMAAPPEQDPAGRATAATAPASEPTGNFAADGTPLPAAAATQRDDAELPAPTVPPAAGALTGEDKAATAPTDVPGTGPEQVRATNARDEDGGVDALRITEIAALLVAVAAGAGALVIWSRREPA